MLVVLHIALLLLFIIALAKELWSRRRSGSGVSATLSVTRGEPSMAMLAGIFAAALGLYAFAIEVSETPTGHKAALIVLDFVLLTYLFFFNSWFRNAMIETAIERHKEER